WQGSRYVDARIRVPAFAPGFRRRGTARATRAVNDIGSSRNGEGGRMQRRGARVMTVATLAGAIAVWSGGAAAHGKNICDLSSEWMLRSCQTQARAEAHLALAKCLNLTTAAATHACRQQAAADTR